MIIKVLRANMNSIQFNSIQFNNLILKQNYVNSLNIYSYSGEIYANR